MGEERDSRQSKEDQYVEESSARKPSLSQTIDLISSLVSFSYSIKEFSRKWKSIHRKLDELLSGLNAIENFSSGDNPLVSTAVQAITATIDECHGLARRCVDLSYSGKLLMQSDLDIVSSKLDSHIKSLADIYNLGLLTQSHAIVVSRPGPAATRHDMKFYVKDLFSRLRIGDTDMKKDALIAFCEVIQEDDKYIKLAIGMDNFIGLLVNLIDLQEIDIQEEAAKAVSIIAGFECYRGVLVGAGIIQPLIRVLESGSELGKEFAVRCLQRMTENSDNAWSVSAHGGVTDLLKICSSYDCGSQLVGLACGVLKNLVGVEEIRRFMVEEGTISLIIKLVRSKYEVSQMSSMELLQTMASNDESIKQMIVQEGGFDVLVRVFDPNSTSSSKAREMALTTIINLCISSIKSLNILMNYGFMDHILYLLRYGEASAQELALKASFWLCGTSEEAKRAMGDAGFMQEVVKFLDSRSYQVREMSAEALSSLVLVPRNRKRFVDSDQNIGLVLRLLNPEESNSGMRKLLLSTLLSLTNCNSARKKIVNSGYMPSIRRLADAEISDAKAIVKKLTYSRFRNIMTAIWRS